MPSVVIPEKYFAYAKCYNVGTSCMPSVVIPEKYFAYAKCCNVGNCELGQLTKPTSSL